MPSRSSASSHEDGVAARRWAKLAEDQPELAPAIEFQRRAWAVLAAAVPAAALPSSTAADVRTSFLSGIPILIAAEARFSDAPPFELLADLARLARRSFRPAGAAEIERAARRRSPVLGDGLCAALRRDHAAVSAAASQLSVPGALFASLCELALSPSFRSLATGIGRFLEVTSWSRGFCPVCASWPLLGEVRDGGRSRHLRCGLCGADWPFARLGCPFCGEVDHRRLRALHVEGEGDFRRAELCESCRGYLKSVATLMPGEPTLLPVEDLATAYLDLMALDEGYRRPEEPPVVAAPTG